MKIRIWFTGVYLAVTLIALILYVLLIIFSNFSMTSFICLPVSQTWSPTFGTLHIHLSNNSDGGRRANSYIPMSIGFPIPHYSIRRILPLPHFRSPEYPPPPTRSNNSNGPTPLQIIPTPHFNGSESSLSSPVHSRYRLLRHGNRTTSIYSLLH
jgi:hypothetical protein